MKKQFVKLILLLIVFGGLVMNADAQRRGRTTRNQPKQQPVDTTKQPVQVNNNNQQPVNYSPYGNTPIKMAPQVGGFNDTVKKSLRVDGAYEKTINERIPLPYEDLRPDDALFSERIWREIDIREKMNQVFRYAAQDDNGDQQFISILVKAVRSGKVTAFSPDDDRFTTPLDSAGFEKALNGGAGNQCDTTPVYNLKDPTKIDSFVVTCPTLNPEDIVKFRIKEDWVFDREASRLFCRIIGIAPCKALMSVDKKTERGSLPLFWVYYPDLRPTLAKYEVYNAKNMGQSRMTWEELFESRMFSSYIIKSTLDNPQNRMIKNYIKDPILALIEGDNIKNKIFNYEQNLWSY
ncbi:MAG TPA: gliding motility protein GldN [Chitinophagaceae bacterium]|nr:gliding motility protein GldN [Chitinophagaceae bacterium]